MQKVLITGGAGLDTLRRLEAARHAGVTKLVYSSSLGIVGGSTWTHVIPLSFG